MKRLLFTHRSDIDGMGSAILSKLAFGDIDYILCKNVSDLDKKIKECYSSGLLYSYDIIYITDLSISNSLADILYNDKLLKERLYIYDHHETAFNNGLNKYPNTNIVISKDNALSCATEIFYDYLIQNNYISKSHILDTFVEMVRREDTYEWKRYNDINSHDLAILFQAMGQTKFISHIVNKLNNNNEFEYSDEELELIADKKEETKCRVIDYLETLEVINIDKYKVGVCFIAYEYRNEVADYLIDEDADLDVVLMIATDNSQISIRSIKDGNAPRIIAERFGGGGHNSAAAIPLTKVKRRKIIDSLFS